VQVRRNEGEVIVAAVPQDDVGLFFRLSYDPGIIDARVYDVAKTLAADKARHHAAAHDLLEHLAQDIALAETPVTVHREGRVVGNRAL